MIDFTLSTHIFPHTYVTTFMYLCFGMFALGVLFLLLFMYISDTTTIVVVVLIIVVVISNTNNNKGYD